MESSPVSSQALPAGTRLEEFVIERVLGSGGFGITYLAKDTALGRQVVIKENLPVQFCFRDPASLTVAPRHSHGDDAENFKWSLENFSKEAAMLASLDHPGIVKVHRSFEAFGTAYFVMPFVEGLTLDELAKARQGKPFMEEELRGLLERVLRALGYLHDRGIYHRDIKPGNLLITTEGIPVLIDFGSARQRLSERSMTVVESAGYTPFEQLQSRGNVGPWSDLYALGGTLVKLITGEVPPKAMDRMRNDPFLPLAKRMELRPRFSPGFLHTLDQALAVEEDKRWQEAGEWLAALRGEVALEMPPPFRSESPSAATEIPGKKVNHLQWILAASVVLGLFALANIGDNKEAAIVRVKDAEQRATRAELEKQVLIDQIKREAAAKEAEKQRAARAEQERQALTQAKAKQEADAKAEREKQMFIAQANAKLFATPNNSIKAPPANSWDLVTIMAKLDIFAKECRFSEASEYLKSLTTDPHGASRASLLSVTDASSVFLTDLKQDLEKVEITGDLPLKSGMVIRKISSDKTGVITIIDSNGVIRPSNWADFSADALISLHRTFVKNEMSVEERLRRHECAISYDWLAGNRERALDAAVALSQTSPEFKKRWESIAKGLPK